MLKVKNQPGASRTSDLLLILLMDFPSSWICFMRRNCIDVWTIIVSLCVHTWVDQGNEMGNIGPIITIQNIPDHTIVLILRHMKHCLKPRCLYKGWDVQEASTKSNLLQPQVNKTMVHCVSLNEHVQNPSMKNHWFLDDVVADCLGHSEGSLSLLTAETGDEVMVEDLVGRGVHQGVAQRHRGPQGKQR